jgi:hypothetical protein
MRIFSAAAFVISPNWNQPKGPPYKEQINYRIHIPQDTI